MTLKNLSLFGATLNTGNLGVSALCYSLIHGLQQTGLETNWNIFDYGRGVRDENVMIGEKSYQIKKTGAYHTRRFYRPESFSFIEWSLKFNGLGSGSAREFMKSDVILDVSGGDSFTDLYGQERFDQILAPKRLALEEGKPLILLPQTYGPFNDPGNEQKALEVIKQARAVWARDEKSKDWFKNKLGEKFDPNFHASGVDMAYLLPLRESPELCSDKLKNWISSDEEIFGLNISGLLYHRAEESQNKFKLQSRYDELIKNGMDAILSNTRVKILLIPHVIELGHSFESDTHACKSILETLSQKHKERCDILTGVHDPCQVKWVISKMNYFCGPRMHATIAGLTTGVPTINLAYSDKPFGIFEHFDLSQNVVDLRRLSMEKVIEGILSGYDQRERQAMILKVSKSKARQRAREQMNKISHQISAF